MFKTGTKERQLSISTSDTTFEHDLRQTEITILDFWAPWCGPCLQFAPIFEESSRKHTDVMHLKVNVDECPNISMSYGITSIPTTIIVREGGIVKRAVGALNAGKLEGILQEARELNMELLHAQEQAGG
jgi:thioredoxin